MTPWQPFRRTSFPSLGDTLERLRFVPVRPQTPSRRIIPEFAVPVAPDPVYFKGLPGSPKFPGNPRDHSPCSPTPARPDTRDGTNCQRIRHGPRVEPRRRLSTNRRFRGSIARLLVWLSTPRSGGRPPPRKTRFRLLVPALPGGSRTRRVPVKGFRILRFFLLSRASWRNLPSLFTRSDS